MMGLDSQIALGIRPPTIADPLAQYANVLAIQHAGNQNALSQYSLAKAKREDADQNALRASLQGVDINTPEGQAQARKALLGIGNVAGAAAFDKSIMDRTNTQSQIDERRVKTALDHVDMVGRALAGVTTDEQAQQVLGSMTASIPAQRDAMLSQYAAARQAGQTPAEIAQSIAASYSKHALDKIKEYAPKVNFEDLGGSKPAVNTNTLAGPVGPLAGVPALPKTPTPGEASSAANRPFTATGAPNVPVQKYELQKANAGKNTTTVNMPPQERSFEAALGKEQAEDLVKSRTAATDAADIIRNVNEGRRIMNSGMITGFGAEALVSIGQALKQAGFDVGGDAAANSQAYAANMAQNVGKIIKQFGSGTGLSNADREYAEKMAAGKITLDKDALVRILDINERVARNVIDRHNEKAKGVKSNIPLTVDAPKVLPKAGDIVDGYRFNGGDPAKRENWSKP